MSLIDVDAAPLKGKIITGALLHVRCSSLNEPAPRVTVSTISAPWAEGKSSSYKPEEGASCWDFARYSADANKAVPWTFPGSTVQDAGFGLGNTIWKFADATRPDAEGWQTIAVDADVVAARAADLCYGLGLWDDVGSEWSYKDNKFKFIEHPNRFLYSKDQNASSAPWLEVWCDGTDTVAPDAVAEKGLKVHVKDLPPGEALVTWITPADKGGTRTLGFDVTYQVGKDPAKPLPRYLVPMAAAAGQPVRMHIQDLPFKAGEEIELSITPVDAAGNRGKALVKKIKVSDNPAVLAIEASDIEPFAPSTKLPEVGGVKVAILDMIDKVEAKTGKMVPQHEDGYKGGNHLWSAEKNVIRLQAARNEFVGFLVNLEGKSNAAGLKVAVGADYGVRSRVYRLDYVKTGAGIMPDAAVPLTGTIPIPISSQVDPEAADQTNASLLAEIYVPHAAKPGLVKGTLTVTSNGQNLQIPIELTIWDFTLPNKLSFLPEMNAYSGVDPTPEGLAYYRLAHEHRTCINRLPYGWNGEARLAPKWDGKTLDFAEWDKQYAPILSGAAFANLPRKGEPVDVFYLPFNESWPMSIWDNFTKSYWPEDAFTPAYREGMQKAYAQFAKHLDQMKWHDTEFQFFLNNKVYYKGQGSGWRNSAAPWIFDEPVNTQDFWALRWYGLLWHQAVDPVKGQVKAWYRCDISRSDFGRNEMWDVMDVVYFGGSSEQKVRQKHDEQDLSPVPTYFCEYGGANDPGTANLAPVTWCLLAWSARGDGRAAVADDRRVSQQLEQRRVDVPVLQGPGRAGGVDPAEGLLPRSAGRGVSHAAGRRVQGPALRRGSRTQADHRSVRPGNQAERRGRRHHQVRQGGPDEFVADAVPRRQDGFGEEARVQAGTGRTRKPGDRPVEAAGHRLREGRAEGRADQARLTAAANQRISAPDARLSPRVRGLSLSVGPGLRGCCGRGWRNAAGLAMIETFAGPPRSLPAGSPGAEGLRKTRVMGLARQAPTTIVELPGA